MFGSIYVMWKYNAYKFAQVYIPQERLDGWVCFDCFSYIKKIRKGKELPVY